MKFLIAALAVLSGSAALAYNDAAIQDAKDLLTVVAQRESKGMATKGDVARAKVFLTTMQYGAGKISREQYCKEVLEQQKLVAEEVSALYANGAVTLETAIKGKRELHNFEAACK